MTDSEMTLQQLFALPGKELPPTARSTMQSSRVMAEVLRMNKLDIAALQRAYQGNPW